MGRAADSSADALERATELFRALSNPSRVAIVRELGRVDLTVTELVERLDMAQPRVSEHLSTLRAANLVDRTRSGRRVTYRLVDNHVAHIVDDAVLHAGETMAAN